MPRRGLLEGEDWAPWPRGTYVISFRVLGNFFADKDWGIQGGEVLGNFLSGWDSRFRVLENFLSDRDWGLRG